MKILNIIGKFYTAGESSLLITIMVVYENVSVVPRLFFDTIGQTIITTQLNMSAG